MRTYFLQSVSENEVQEKNNYDSDSDSSNWWVVPSNMEILEQLHHPTRTHEWGQEYETTLSRSVIRINIQTSKDFNTLINVDSTDMAIIGGKPPLPGVGCPNTGGGVAHVHVIK
jgi:hypothetical protein